jgi:hypothetical protein
VSGVLHILFGLFLAAAGCIPVFGFFFMGNDCIQQNINVPFVNPLLLGMVPLGLFEAAQFSRVRSCAWLKRGEG